MTDAAARITALPPMTTRTRKAHLGYHADNVRVTAIGGFLYFRVRHSRQVTRVAIEDCIPLGKPLDPVPAAEDPRQVVLPFITAESTTP